MTTRVRTQFRCTSCGVTSPRWSGRCGGCGEWNTSVEQQRSASGSVAPGSDAAPVVALHAVDDSGGLPDPTGVAEFDRVLAGGLVPGSVTLVSGPPGIGKSTLALQLAAGVAARPGGGVALYVAAEETAPQIRRRAARLGCGSRESLLVAVDPSLAAVVDAISEHRPDVVVIDSIQTVFDEAVDSAPGGVTQVRTCAQRLAQAARTSGAGVVLIGHVTKDGQVAGPRLLEHLVDTVVTLGADAAAGADHGLRFLRATKHRFGPVGELGVFRMEADGMCGVADAAGLFLDDRPLGVAGSVVSPALDGRRVMVSEVQALVGGPGGPPAVQLAQGVDRGRLGLVVAVLARQVGLSGEVFCSVAGGARVTEPGADLAIAVALASASTGVPVRASTVVCGEVGLVGEVRRVHSVVERVREVARLGFERVIVPQATSEDVDALGIEVVRVADVQHAIRAALDGVESSLTYRAATHESATIGGGDLRTFGDVGTMGM